MLLRPQAIALLVCSSLCSGALHSSTAVSNSEASSLSLAHIYIARHPRSLVKRTTSEMVRPPSSSGESLSKNFTNVYIRQQTTTKRIVDSVMLLLLSVFLLLPTAGGALDTTYCRAKLIDADKNSDERLDETEFVDIVKQLSDGAFGKRRLD